MKKIIIYICIIFCSSTSILATDANIEETYWIHLTEEWDMNDVNQDRYRIGSTLGQIIYFGTENRFYYLDGLLDLLEGKLVELDLYENAVGFYGTWKVIGDYVEIHYTHFESKFPYKTPNRYNPDFKRNIKKLKKTKIKISDNQFEIDYYYDQKKVFIQESALKVKVTDNTINDFYGSEHNPHRNVMIKKKISRKENFGLKYSPNKKQCLVLNGIENKNFVLYEKKSENTKYEIKVMFSPKFRVAQIEIPDEVKWKKNKIVLVYSDKTILLYLKEKLLEITGFRVLDISYYDYMHLQIDQLFDSLQKADKSTLLPFFKPFLGKRIDNNFFMDRKEISLEAFEKIGNFFHLVISKLKKKYDRVKAFQIFERSYNCCLLSLVALSLAINQSVRLKW